MKQKYTKFQIALEIIGLLLLAGLVVFICLRWGSLPDKIPGHYNAAGEINRWGDKSEILAMLIIVGVLYLLLTVVTFFPQAWNIPVKVTEANKAAVYGSIKSMLILLKVIFAAAFFYITYTMINLTPMSVYMLPAILLLLSGVIGFSLHKAVKIAKTR